METPSYTNYFHEYYRHFFSSKSYAENTRKRAFYTSATTRNVAQHSTASLFNREFAAQVDFESIQQPRSIYIFRKRSTSSVFRTGQDTLADLFNTSQLAGRVLKHFPYVADSFLQHISSNLLFLLLLPFYSPSSHPFQCHTQPSFANYRFVSAIVKSTFRLVPFPSLPRMKIA